MTDANRKKWMRRAVKLGIAIGIACHFAPPEYQTVCQAVSQIASLCGAGVP